MSGRSKEVRKAYYQRNREKILGKAKESYLKKREILSEYQKEYRTKNRKWISQKKRDKYQLRLEKAITLLGGCCSRCKESFDPVCYDFHHVDPSIKDITLGGNMLIGEDRFFRELEKCILLCSNCHRLLHKELRNAA